MKALHPAAMLRASAIAALVAFAALSGPASAQTRYRPILETFDAKRAIVLPPAPALVINGSGTIEFWVAAKWTANLDYDPAIMAFSGRKGPRFAFHISSDRKALGVYAGAYYDQVAFNFADGRLHFVAIETIGDSLTLVFIDGQERAALGFGFADLPATNFSIGSIGTFSPFIGEIGQIRIWDTPLEREILNQYALRPIDDHPMIDSLVGISAFGNPETGGFVFIGEPDDPNITAELPVPSAPARPPQ